MTTPGTLYLIPVPLGDDGAPADVLPAGVIATACTLDLFVVENEKTARRVLGRLPLRRPVRELELRLLNEHTAARELPALLEPLLAGRNVGLMSEAGCPGVADPGARLVALAHQHGITVRPLVGPSSILLALMASGMNGQHFTFLGYLPANKTARIARIREIEQQSAMNGSTQIFIETPYRNQHLLADLLAHCRPQTQLCVAVNLTQPQEQIQTRTIAQWRTASPRRLDKQPAVFLLASPPR